MQIYTLEEWIANHGTLVKAAEALNVTKQNLSYSRNKVKGATIVVVDDNVPVPRLFREVPLKKAP